MNTASSPTYETTRIEQLRTVGVVRIHGIPLEFAGQKPGLDTEARYLPIRGCLCVHDSPDSPCPCKDLIVWLPWDRIVRSGAAGRKDANGVDIVSFEVPNDANILVERLSPVRAEIFAQALTSRGESGMPDRIAQKGKVGAKTAVRAAFTLGWLLGTKINEETGASDTVSDWLLETLGPAPDWLSDLF